MIRWPWLTIPCLRAAVTSAPKTYREKVVSALTTKIFPLWKVQYGGVSVAIEHPHESVVARFAIGRGYIEETQPIPADAIGVDVIRISAETVESLLAKVRADVGVGVAA